MPDLNEQLDIKIIDTVFDPNIYGAEEKPVLPGGSDDAKFDVHYYEADDLYHYKVWLFLAGNDLPFVQKIIYQLHETFPEQDRNKTVWRSPSNPNCQLVIWTWGIFQVNATIYDKNGRVYTLSHQLNYGNLLEEFDDKINYISDNQQSSGGAMRIA